jgi:hypothetical protein
MSKTLLKIAGIVFLSTIPHKINEPNFSYLNTINLPKITLTKENKPTQRENINSAEIQDINSEIELLNQKREFFLMRIKEYDSLALIKGYDSVYEIRKDYENDLKATERKIRKYRKQKQSLKN